LGIPIVQGREFTRADAISNPRVIVINEAMAQREFPDQDPIGQRFSFESARDGVDQSLEVVGVVANIKQYGMEQDPVPTIFAVHTFSPSQALTVMVRAAAETSS